MPIIVNIVLQTQEHMNSPMTESIARTIFFNSEEAGRKFAKGFREEYLYDGTESRYVSKIVTPMIDEDVDIMYTITMENGVYILGHELVTETQVQNNPAMLATQTQETQYSAFALLKNGEILELEDGNAGNHTFYTENYDLALNMNVDAV